MIGLAGAHRVGKTTTAKMWAEKTGIEYITPDVKGTIASLGLECSDIHTVESRLKVQRKVVEACANTFLKRRDTFITDRTPIDVAAYTLADASQHLTPAQSKEMVEIVEDCFSIANSCFHGLIFVQPGIPWISVAGSPKENSAYQEHINILVQGLVQDERTVIPWWCIPRWNVELNARNEAVDQVFNAVREHAVYQLEGATIN